MDRVRIVVIRGYASSSCRRLVLHRWLARGRGRIASLLSVHRHVLDGLEQRASLGAFCVFAAGIEDLERVLRRHLGLEPDDPLDGAAGRDLLLGDLLPQGYQRNERVAVRAVAPYEGKDRLLLLAGDCLAVQLLGKRVHWRRGAVARRGRLERVAGVQHGAGVPADDGIAGAAKQLEELGTDILKGHLRLLAAGASVHPGQSDGAGQIHGAELDLRHVPRRDAGKHADEIRPRARVGVAVFAVRGAAGAAAVRGRDWWWLTGTVHRLRDRFVQLAPTFVRDAHQRACRRRS